MHDNPLHALAEFPRFDHIRPEHGVPAVRRLITDAETAIAAIEADCPATWDGRIRALHDVTTPVWRAWGIIEHLVSVANSPGWRSVEETLQPEVVAFSMRVAQSRPLYAALCALRDTPACAAFETGRRRVIDAALRAARDSGISLEDEAKAKFNACVNTLTAHATTFANHVLDATQAFSLLLRHPDEVAGLPPTLREACAQSARAAGESTATAEHGPWRVTLESALYGPFMQYADRRDLRQALYRANIARASSGTHDNTPLIDDILARRREMAALLNYPHYAQLSLASKMAGTPEAVYAMINRIGDVARERAREELAALRQFAASSGFEGPLMHEDLAYWSRRQVEALFGYSPESLRPYFPLEHVLDGLFALVNRLTGACIVPADGEAPVWHPDVRFFRVTDAQNQTLAWFYLDPYSRPKSKRGGAWMNAFQTRERRPDGSLKLPIALMVCNQAVPSGGRPSCMTPGEIRTLFHEFGHAIQHMLTHVDIPQVSGINTIEWDAVEIASQFLENWCLRPEVLRTLSRHVETGEPLDDDTLARIQASNTHHAALQTLRQLRFACVDLDLHTHYPSPDYPTIAATEQCAAERFSVMPPLPEDRFLCSFSHIFAGGYAAGYYSYLWAEVLAADAFASFEEAGLDNDEAVRRMGRRYAETLLGRGGSEHPMDVFKAFRGREPDVRALLRHKGLLD